MLLNERFMGEFYGTNQMVVVEFQSTVENICRYFLDEIKKASFPQNVKNISIRIYETNDDYAEEETKI